MVVAHRHRAVVQITAQRYPTFEAVIQGFGNRIKASKGLPSALIFGVVVGLLLHESPLGKRVVAFQ